MKNKLQKYSLLAEIVSAIAIVVSLIFVGIEVRQNATQTEQNTIALQVNVYQDLINQINNQNMLVIENPKLAILTSQFDQPWDKLDTLDRVQAMSFFYLLFRYGDIAFHQFESGMINKERLNSALQPLIHRLRYQMVSVFWEDNKENFVKSYRDFIDSMVVK